MDSITHLALGACIGQAMAGKQLGSKAAILGALVHSLPDIDIVSSLWMSTPGSLLAHRGFTHSFLCCLLMAPLLAIITNRWRLQSAISLIKWISLICVMLLAHIFLDAFNNYGVGWWEPFSHQRISFNTLYVADPFFTLAPVIACIIILFARTRQRVKMIASKTAIIISTVYLGYCLINKIRIDQDTRDILSDQKISYTRYFTTPAPLQNWLWWVVAGNDSGYYAGYRSVFDSRKMISFRYFPRNGHLLNDIKNSKDILQLIRFSQQYFAVEKRGDTVVFNDLRFGQSAGWYDPQAQFSFHYFLGREYNNKMVVQRGRFAGWNQQSIRSMWTRIKGN